MDARGRHQDRRPAALKTQTDILSAELDVYLHPEKAQTLYTQAIPGAVPVAEAGAGRRPGPRRQGSDVRHRRHPRDQLARSMGIWLKNRPDLQLKNNAGVAQPIQLDISHPGALAFYTSLIDQYSDVFTTDYWHMGADEYMIGTSFANYTALTAWSKEQYGANATIGDAFISFINQVNTHVKSKGKSLRIWNDGVITTQVVELDKDIIVEFWDGAGRRPADLISDGYKLMTANGVLYWSRSALFFKMDSANLWNTNWNVGKFPGNNANLDPDNPNILGAKVSIWPDDSWYQTENEVEAEVFDSIRFISPAHVAGRPPRR